MTATDLIVDGLSKRYGQVRALDGAHLAAARGEVHALLGENGAGKSTLMKVLAGAVRPDSGSVTLDGQRLAFANPRAALRAGVATAFQELSLFPDLSVAHNLLWGRAVTTPIGTINRRRLYLSATEQLERLGITGIDVRRQVRDLPVAQRQIVEVARAAAQATSVLILDESTSALPATDGDWVLRIARERAAAGIVVLFISHRMGEIRSVADRVTIFRSGTAVATHPIADVSDDEAVSLMLGRRVAQVFPNRTPVAEPQPRLRVTGLTSTRLRGIDLSVGRGEIVGIAGLQGQGQRELFSALIGAGRARGTVSVDGKPVRLSGPRAALAAGIALLPEDRHGEGLLLTKSVQDNVTLAVLDQTSNFGVLDRRRQSELTDDLGTRLNIKAASWRAPVSALSGGNQQKVVLAKLLATRADVLLLFDATRGIDVGAKAELYHLLDELARDGKSILFYSTDLQELVHMCDRVAVMSGGAITGVLSREELSEEAILRVTVGATQALATVGAPSGDGA